jgi:hypothetical protein
VFISVCLEEMTSGALSSAARGGGGGFGTDLGMKVSGPWDIF